MYDGARQSKTRKASFRIYLKHLNARVSSHGSAAAATSGHQPAEVSALTTRFGVSKCISFLISEPQGLLDVTAHSPFLHLPLGIVQYMGVLSI